MRFVDTNLLLYAASTAPEEEAKSRAAQAVLDSDDLGLSVQVLQEFYVQATRSGKQDRLTHHQLAISTARLRYPRPRPPGCYSLRSLWEQAGATPDPWSRQTRLRARDR